MRFAQITTRKPALESKSRNRYAVPPAGSTLRATPKRHRHEPRRRSEKRPTGNHLRFDRHLRAARAETRDEKTARQTRTRTDARTETRLRGRKRRRSGSVWRATHLVEVACSRSRSFAHE